MSTELYLAQATKDVPAVSTNEILGGRAELLMSSTQAVEVQDHVVTSRQPSLVLRIEQRYNILWRNICIVEYLRRV